MSKSVKEQFEVRPIPTEQTKNWILKKHYAKRMPPISYAFGLYDESKSLQGIMTFGIPASRFDLDFQPYELNRLVVNEGLGKNVLSYFVGQTLKKFPEKACIVSYADPNNGHHGYIYQATNWIYTGVSSPHDKWFIDGRELHEKSIFNMWGTNSVEGLKRKGLTVTIEKQEPKHRYFYFINDEGGVLKGVILGKYRVLPYPKGDNLRYDASYEPTTQGVLI